MEILQKKRKIEARNLLRTCFIDAFFLLSLIPFEIWKHIMNISDLKSIVFLSQTCWAFSLMFDDLQTNKFSIATRFRRNNQIPLGK